jgi:predicted amidohydrolase YtcJ
MTSRPAADLLLLGRIASLAGDEGPGWVEGIAIADGRVIAGGRRSDVESLASRTTRRMTMPDDTVAIPGLTDAHLHLAETALARQRVDLEGAASADDLAARVAQGAGRNQGDWITGGGWDPDLLGRWPTTEDIGAVAAGRQVALWAHDHHALLVSPAALEAAGIDAARADPPGGRIRRDADGRATGVLHENAARLVADLVPPPAADQIRSGLEALQLELLELGVVAVHDPGMLAAQAGLGPGIEAVRRLAADGRLGIRVHACVRSDQLATAIGAGLRSGFPLGEDPLDHLRLGWLKTFADGSLGSRTAVLLAPLETEPAQASTPEGGYGTWLTPPAELRAQAVRAADAGISTQIHAIGDGAVRAALDALAPTVWRTALMPRLEHAQLVADEDVSRFALLGIAASVQPIHLRSDTDKARLLWGQRAEARMFPLRALADAGTVMAFGTDAPVEPFNPWPGISCAVMRQAPTWAPGTPAIGPGSAIPLWDAVRAACVGPALTAGEHDRGRLVAGSRADVVVIPRDAVAEPAEVGGALWNVRPTMVLVDGRVVIGD